MWTRTIYSSFKLAFLTMIILVLSACGGGPFLGTPIVAKASVYYPGNLLGVASSGTTSTYYIPVLNSGNIDLTLNSIKVSNTHAWSVVACTLLEDKLKIGKSCTLAVTFNASAITDDSQLNAIVTLNFSNGLTTSFPVSGTILSSKDLVMQAPIVLVPDSKGNAYGVITAFNNTEQSLSFNTSTIIASDTSGIWSFTANCDGNGSSIIQPKSSCSISFVYVKKTAQLLNFAKAVNSGDSSKVVDISVPITDQTGEVKVYTLSTTLAPAQTGNMPYLVYLDGNISMASITTATIPLLNLGNAALNGINISGLPTNISQSNNCTNVPVGGLCTITLTLTSGVTPPFTTLTIAPINQASGNAVQFSILGQALSVSPAFADYNTIVGGGTLTKQFTISNLGSQDLNYTLGAIAGSGTFVLNPGTCTGSNLAAFSSCIFSVSYVAENITGSDSASLVVDSSTPHESPQTITFVGKSKSFSSLSVSPTFADYGTVFGGGTVTKQFTISNLGLHELNYNIGAIVGSSSFVVESGTCTSGNLVSLGSCVFNINYVAQNITGSDSGSLVVDSSTPYESPQTINLTGRSKLFNSWVNTINSGGYNQSGNAITALMPVNKNGLAIYVANATVGGSAWKLFSDGTWLNVTDGLPGYHESPITAFNLAVADDQLFVVGHYDDQVQLCSFDGATCQDFFPAASPVLTSPHSFWNVNQNIGIVGFVDLATGTTGQLLGGAGSGSFPVTAGVGKMAPAVLMNDGYQYLYVPTSDGRIYTLSDPWTDLGPDVAPASLFSSGEYPTVAFYDSNSNILYAGTNFANVYSSIVPASSGSWTKLNSSRLSNTSYISAIAANLQGDLYIGLATRTNQASGGGLYILFSGDTSFITAPNYTDPSSISDIVFDGTNLYIGTYLGNVWKH